MLNREISQGTESPEQTHDSTPCPRDGLTSSGGYLEPSNQGKEWTSGRPPKVVGMANNKPWRVAQMRHAWQTGAVPGHGLAWGPPKLEPNLGFEQNPGLEPELERHKEPKLELRPGREQTPEPELELKPEQSLDPELEQVWQHQTLGLSVHAPLLTGDFAPKTGGSVGNLWVHIRDKKMVVGSLCL